MTSVKGWIAVQGRRVVVQGPGRAACESFPVDEADGRAVWIRPHHTLISAGTEGAAFRNATGHERYPQRVGYAAVGEVVREGSAFPDVRRGDMVFTYAAHQDPAPARGLCVPLPAGLSSRQAVFARLATVAMTALRVSAVELGDHVVVLGQGVVGNLCAQLFQLAGAEVLVADPVAARLDTAAACGVRQCVLATDPDAVRQAVRDFTGGRGAEATVEAVGRPELVAQAMAVTGPLGEVILLGSPRGAHEADVTPLLESVHLWDRGCITLKGAHEWRYPVRQAAGPGCKHSLERNSGIALRLIAGGRLAVEPLCTHVLDPGRAQEAYEGLRDHPDTHLGVLFAW